MQLTNMQRELIAEKYYKYLCTAKEIGGYKVYIPPLYTRGGRRVIPDFVTALYNAKGIIEDLNLDPIVYFRAQLRAFEQRAETMIPPRFLWDNGAIERVQKWIADAKSRFGTENISVVPDTRKDIERMEREVDERSYRKILKDCNGNRLLALCLSTPVVGAGFIVNKLVNLEEEEWDDYLGFLKGRYPDKRRQVCQILSKK